LGWNQYIYLKSLFNCKDSRIDFSKVLSKELINISYGKVEPKDIKMLSLLKLFFTLDLGKIKNALEMSNLLITNFIDRLDHKKLTDCVIEDLENLSITRIDSLPRKLTFNIKNVYTSIIDCLPYFKSGLKYQQVVYLIVNLAHYKNIEQSLYTLICTTTKINLKKYLALNSSIGLETIFTQAFNNYTDIITYSLTHGQTYIKYKNFRPLDNINGENITSRYVIVWGKRQKQELIENFNFSKNRIKIGGNPKYASEKRDYKTTFRNCLIFLPRETYDSDNYELLKILSNLIDKVRFTIKPHPSLDVVKYRGITEQYGYELIEKTSFIIDEINQGDYDFSITFNSTSYHEAMFYGLICFRFDRGNDIYIGLNDLFKDHYELVDKMNYFKNISQGQISGEISILLEEVLGVGINSYKKILS